MKRSARLLLVVLALALAMVAVACGDDDDTSAASATTATPAPEDLRAPADQVAAGLQQIEGIAQQAAAAVGTDQGQAKELADSIEPIWFTIEGTIKANDTNVYLDFEDAFASLSGAAEKGDTARAATAAAEVEQSVADYLAKYPG
jgi:hypothetical protein